jgi:hypothetical protein
MIKESQHCMQIQVKPCNSVMTAGGSKVTIVRIKQVLVVWLEEHGLQFAGV